MSSLACDYYELTALSDTMDHFDSYVDDFDAPSFYFKISGLTADQLQYFNEFEFPLEHTSYAGQMGYNMTYDYTHMHFDASDSSATIEIRNVNKYLDLDVDDDDKDMYDFLDDYEICSADEECSLSITQHDDN